MEDFISLKEAADHCEYSQEYLSLRARQGKLRAAKLGRNWVTTRGWLKEYIGKPIINTEQSDSEERTLILKSSNPLGSYTERSYVAYAPTNLPVYDEEAEAAEDDYHEDAVRQRAFLQKLEFVSAFAAFLILFGMGILLWGSDISLNSAYFAWLGRIISSLSY